MALIACPDCSREVSDSAVACPYCGCPVSEKVKLQQKESQQRASDAQETHKHAQAHGWRQVGTASSPPTNEPDDEPSTRLFPNAQGAGLVVLRFVGLVFFIFGLNLWFIPANRVIDRIVLGFDEAPLPEPILAFFYFGGIPLLGTGFMAGILWTIRDTRFHEWATKNLDNWKPAAFLGGFFALYIVGMSFLLTR